MASTDTTKRCPFGCDEPYPHENGCVWHVSDEAWDKIQEMIATPPKPNEALKEIMRRNVVWAITAMTDQQTTRHSDEEWQRRTDEGQKLLDEVRAQRTKGMTDTTDAEIVEQSDYPGEAAEKIAAARGISFKTAMERVQEIIDNGEL